MKKALLFAIIALSVNAFAQTKQLTFPKRHLSLNFPEKLQKSSAHKVGKSTGTYSKMNPGEPKVKPTPQKHFPDDLIQLYDSTYEWEWDDISIKWKLHYKYTDVIYGANNILKSYIGKIRDGNTWVNSEKILISYDSRNNVTLNLYQDWNGTAWVNNAQEIYTYDSHNNETSYLAQDWNGTGWVNSWQTIHTYDVNNNIITEYDQEWKGSSWDNLYKEIYVYDANNNPTSYTFQSGTGTIWTNSWKSNYTYDAGKKLISELVQNWVGNTWLDSDKNTFTYDASNNLTVKLGQYLNGAIWINSAKDTYTYNASYKLINELNQIWVGNAWLNSSKIVYTYDANANETSNLHQNWSGIAWVNLWQYAYTFDNNNFMKSAADKEWNIDGTLVENGDSTYYYYHILVSGISDFKEASVTVYPNPTKGMITVGCERSISGIEIYSLTGNLVYFDYKFKQQYSKEIDLSTIPKGIYFAKIYNGTRFYNRKIVIQ